MRLMHAVALAVAMSAQTPSPAAVLMTAGQPAELQIRATGEHSVRVTLKPVTFAADFPATPAVVDRAYPAPAIRIQSLATPVRQRVGRLRVEVSPSPLTVTITNAAGQLVQKLAFGADGTLVFALDDQPVLGMGEGGPRPAPGTPWREQPVQFDRRGALDTMEPRWQSDMYGSRNPAAALKDFSTITGPAAMPPKWALGYMQSHRTLEDDTQMLGIIDTFRSTRIPLDAVIYLGTGFAPRGWNTRQPSFDFNPDVFTRDPTAVLADMHARNVKVVVHMVPWDRDKLPALDEARLKEYWQQHVPLVRAGIDAFWPDEGDWFNLFERITRFRLYYQGHLSTTPNVRPWSLQRNGFPGIAQWGGWVWSGDTETSWKTLEAQIAVGLGVERLRSARVRQQQRRAAAGRSPQHSSV